MTTGNDFIKTIAVVAFFIFILKKLEKSLPSQPFIIKFIELDDYERAIIQNISENVLNLTVRNDDIDKAIYLRYDSQDTNLTPGMAFDIMLMPGQVLSGRTYYGNANISILIQSPLVSPISSEEQSNKVIWI